MQHDEYLRRATALLGLVNVVKTMTVWLLRPMVGEAFQETQAVLELVEIAAELHEVSDRFLELAEALQDDLDAAPEPPSGLN